MRSKFWLQSLKSRDHLENLGIDGNVILKGSYVNRFRECGLDSSGSRQGPVAGSCEHCDIPYGPIS
jgi:hypothetical protein